MFWSPGGSRHNLEVHKEQVNNSLMIEGNNFVSSVQCCVPGTRDTQIYNEVLHHIYMH